MWDLFFRLFSLLSHARCVDASAAVLSFKITSLASRYKEAPKKGVKSVVVYAIKVFINFVELEQGYRFFLPIVMIAGILPSQTPSGKVSRRYLR